MLFKTTTLKDDCSYLGMQVRGVVIGILGVHLSPHLAHEDQRKFSRGKHSDAILHLLSDASRTRALVRGGKDARSAAVDAGLTLGGGAHQKPSYHDKTELIFTTSNHKHKHHSKQNMH